MSGEAAVKQGRRAHRLTVEFEIGDAMFERVRALAARIGGIALYERHRAQIARRGARLGLGGAAELEELLSGVERGDARALQCFVELTTTGFTGFFRTPAQFEAAREHIGKAVQRRGWARAWSAAASTGEEPYSLAMALSGLWESGTAPVKILATDINCSALDIARRGEYGPGDVSGLAPAVRARFFTAAEDGKVWRIADEMRQMVEFRVLNLAATEWPVAGSFDVIFCRNVLMYLEPRCRDAVLLRMSELLAADGALVLDPAEHAGRTGALFGRSRQGVYSRAKAGAGP
ncbi:MAG: hypothetical protein HY821_00305 [Acidobacteria bacterium]|nr:hypothetical protein [Acidobacteriota bacterium]